MRSDILFRLSSLLALCVITAPAWAGYRMLIHKVTHQVANDFVIVDALPQSTGWYVVADPLGELFQPHVGVETREDQAPDSNNVQAAGSISVALKDAKGKVVAEVEDKGILGAATMFSLTIYRSSVVMFMKAGASDSVGAIHDNGHGSKQMEVTMSPATFGKGSQLILKFAGHLPETTSDFSMNPSRWGDQVYQDHNLPFGHLGRITYQQFGQAAGGQNTITVDFELIEE